MAWGERGCAEVKERGGYRYCYYCKTAGFVREMYVWRRERMESNGGTEIEKRERIQKRRENRREKELEKEKE